MSEQLNALQVENANLKKKAENNSRGVEGLLAQIDAHKGLIHENLGQNLQLRTNIILFQKEQKALVSKIEDLNKKLSDALTKIAQLEKPVDLKEQPDSA